MQRKTIKVDIAGKELVFETGKIARQAGGSVLVHCNETTVLATACAAAAPTDSIDFLPLRVDYQAKFASAGRTLGGFIKREGRPNTRDILTSRLIDRSLRPLFEDGYYNETQILAFVYSFDGQTRPDVLAICAASAALTISEIPFINPLGAVRVGKINGTFVVNPTVEEQALSSLDLVMAGTESAILMIEGYCDFLSEEEVLAAIEFGHKFIIDICRALSAWREEVGKPKILDCLRPLPLIAKQEVAKICEKELIKALAISDKKQRESAMGKIKEEMMLALFNEGKNPGGFTEIDAKLAFKGLSSTIMRNMVLKTKSRIDKRKINEIRPIDIECNLLPRTHGSALFTRGETQSISICTLGGATMGQRYEDLHGEGTQSFYLQYFFPPFSVGEVGRSGPPGRRELGHGTLAERALSAILPPQEKFPYTIRLESNITESNGSSSMASVCGGCLAMMLAGVPIKKPVSGIAMGLILENEDFVILSDILGAEDALGDMDFKITGDEQGITAFQMDIKVEGITHEIMKAALMQAKEGRIHILKEMFKACPKVSSSLSIYAPRIETIKIKPSLIGTVIGPGGKQIRSIIEETGVEIDINDEGIISIASTNGEAMERAKAIIHDLTADIDVNGIYKGVVVSIKPFGMFIKLPGGKEGLCHISQVSKEKVDDLNDLYRVGAVVEVKVVEISNQGPKEQIRLSIKELLK